MSRPLRVGVQLPEVERRVEWPELFAMARTAEAVGFDSIWLGDHLLYDLPGGITRGPWEVWTSLAGLASIRTPAMICAGEHDVVRADHTAQLAATIPGARLWIVPGASHGAMLEQPELVNRTVLEFT